MIIVLEIDTSGEVMTVTRRRMYLGSLVYAMLKINGLTHYSVNGREYLKI